MQPDAINMTYESIANPILRLMLWMLAAHVIVLGSAVVYLYRERQVLQREMIQANFDAISALSNVADAIEALRNDLSKLTPPTP